MSYSSWNLKTGVMLQYRFFFSSTDTSVPYYSWLHIGLWRNVCEDVASIQDFYKQASQTRSMDNIMLPSVPLRDNSLVPFDYCSRNYAKKSYALTFCSILTVFVFLKVPSYTRSWSYLGARTFWLFASKFNMIIYQLADSDHIMTEIQCKVNSKLWRGIFSFSA